MFGRESLSGPDNAWRRMGTAENLTTITGVLWFDEPIGYDELCTRLEERLLRFDRFRQRVGGRKRRVLQPYWETMEDMDVETHVYHVGLPDPGDKATFQRFVSTLMSRPLDERRPLWEAYLVEGLEGTDGNAVAFRLNHSIGDGFALLYVLFGLVDDPESIELPMGIVPDPPAPDEFREGAADGGTERLEDGDAVGPDTAGDDADGPTADGESDGSDGTDDDPPSVRVDDDGDADPGESGLSLGDGPLGKVGLAGTAVGTAWELLTQEDEAETSLRGDLGTVKRAAWTEEIPLADVKAIGRSHDATVNDVLLGALAGAFRRLLQSRGEDVDGLELRTTVPVNLRPMAERDESLGNHFGLVFLPIPVGEAELDERIEIIHDRMDAERAGVEAYLMYLTLAFGGRAPEFVQRFLEWMFTDRATGVVTNVPGPVDAVEFAGREVTDVMFWVPQAIDQGLGVSIFSYDGGVRLGVATDANLVEEPEALADAFEAELAQLLEDVE